MFIQIPGAASLPTWLVGWETVRSSTSLMENRQVSVSVILTSKKCRAHFCHKDIRKNVGLWLEPTKRSRRLKYCV